MQNTPTYQQQIIQTHAGLIVASVQAAQAKQTPPELEQAFKVSEQNGWTSLIDAIRKIITGERSETLLKGLDEEDQIIIDAVLKGIQDPTTLPDPTQQADATMAAPGLAGMIHAARTGQPQALQMLAGMAEQMTSAGGDMARLGGIMKKLVDGERDIEILNQGMGAQGNSLLQSILNELGKLELH